MKPSSTPATIKVRDVLLLAYTDLIVLRERSESGRINPPESIHTLSEGIMGATYEFNRGLELSAIRSATNVNATQLLTDASYNISVVLTHLHDLDASLAEEARFDCIEAAGEIGRVLTSLRHRTDAPAPELSTLRQQLEAERADLRRMAYLGNLARSRTTEEADELTALMRKANASES